MRVGAIIQARVSSTRLPAKILKRLPLGGKETVLAHVIRRLRRSKHIDKIIVATTIGREDNPIIKIARKEKAECFRGSRDDVLSRYYLAAKQTGLEVIARITSDCPCVDPAIVDSVIEEQRKFGADYASNALKRTFPRGLDAEVFSFEALQEAHKLAGKKSEREHVTPYLYTRPDTFKIASLEAPAALHRPDIRITLDTEEDYILLSAVFGLLYPANNFFDSYDIVRLFEKKPWLGLINRNVVQKKI